MNNVLGVHQLRNMSLCREEMKTRLWGARICIYKLSDRYINIYTFSARKSKRKAPPEASGGGRGQEQQNLAERMYPRISCLEAPASVCRIPEKLWRKEKKNKNKITPKHTLETGDA